ncbi:MAG: hypothetical protein S4CHLAM123_04130 [Chlamydiales bacterium]|nr:hypothetical protein [Chlamydiales bacterium]
MLSYRFFLCTLSFLSLKLGTCFGVGFHYPDPVVYYPYEAEVNYEMVECNEVYPITPVVFPYLGYRGGDGLGYRCGYETAGFQIVGYQPLNRLMPFLDFEFHRVDEGKLALNVGGGFRLFSNTYDALVGANVYYDRRHFSKGDLQQIGVGVELLNRCWDVRGNAYVPFGDGRQVFVDSTRFDYSEGSFAERDKFITALWGADVEIGGWLWNCNRIDFYAAIGPYYYSTGCCCSLVGGMGRFEALICNNLRLQLYVYYDNVFNTNVQGEITFNTTLPKALYCLKCLFMPVYRNRIIVSEETCCWKSNF